MSNPKNCCYLYAANKTLADEEVEDVMSKVQKGICEMLPTTLITEDTKEEIWLPSTTARRASHFIKKDLKESLEPRKLNIFLSKLENVQRLHAEKIREVYIRELQARKCPRCPQVPEVPLSEPRQEQGPPAEGVRQMEIADSTS